MTIKKQQIFSFLVCLIWTQSILVQYVRAVVMRLPIIGSFPDVVITAVFAIVIVLSLSSYKITRTDLLFLFCVFLLFSLNWMFNQKASEYVEQYMVDFLLLRLPIYIVGVSFSEFEERDKVIQIMFILSVMTIFADILYRFTFGTAMDTVQSLYEGDMDKAYKLLPHCCLIAYYAIRKTDLFKIFCMVLCGFYLFMLGTRGAALIYVVFIAFVFIIGSSSKRAIARTLVLAGGIGAFLSSSLYVSSLLWMYQKAQSFGLSVRVFDKLLTGTAANSTGRDLIRETLTEKILKNPVFGYGLFSDRVFGGGYAHNIALEFWVDFGVVFGSILIFALFAVLIRGFISADTMENKGLVISLLFSSVLMLFLSGSVFNSYFPMFLLGLCVGNIRSQYNYSKNVMG